MNSEPSCTTISRFLRLMFRPGDIFEVRAPKTMKSSGTSRTTVSGYYSHDRLDEAAAAIARIDAAGRAPGIYVTLNPVTPSLLARAAHRLSEDVKETTGDIDIVHRQRLLIDVDPKRPTGVSSTQDELDAAEACIRRLVADLTEAGWPEPLLGMSGNGWHAVYAVDLPAEDEGLVQRVLGGLASRYDSDRVQVDRSVHNASRITKVLGTTARKGDDLVGVSGVEDRPHRHARLVTAPAQMREVSVALLESVALPKPALNAPRRSSTSTPNTPGGALPRFDRFERTPEGVRGYLESHGVAVKAARVKERGTFLCLHRCPVVPDCESTGDTDIAVLVGPNGVIAYTNLHNRGQGLHWMDVREALEPGYAEFARSHNGTSGSSGSAAGGDDAESWPEPELLPSGMPPVLPFDPAWLPEPLRAWVVDIANRVQCPIDFIAVTAMVALSALVGRKLGIRPKACDDWLVVPNLWGAAIGRPGVMKTPAIQEALKPLKKFELDAKKEYDEAVKDSEAEQLVDEVRKKESVREIKKHLKNPEEASRIARESLPQDDDKPVRHRHIVNDSSVEKLGEILNENSNGVLVLRDELVGLLKALDKEGQEGARSFYLEAWNGNGRYTFDRIGRGTIDIDAAIVSIIGGIQPGPLSEYLREAVKQSGGDDGLIQRFQMMVYPDVSGGWVNVDQWPDGQARKAAFETFEGVRDLEPDLVGADRDSADVDSIPFLRFDAQAQPLFDEWREALEPRVRSGDLHPALESHLAKYRSLIPSLALILHLADGGRGAVGLAPLRQAIAWGEYLESHARRVYAAVCDPDLAAARELSKHIERGDLGDEFPLRAVYRKGWSGLSSAEQARAAAEYLADLGWLTVDRVATGGRDTSMCRLNPKLRVPNKPNSSNPPPGATDRTARSLPQTPSDGSVSSVQAAGRETPSDAPGSSGAGSTPPGAPEHVRRSCSACGRARWWRSADGEVDPAAPASPATGWTCASCHPPVCPERVVWREGDAQ